MASRATRRSATAKTIQKVIEKKEVAVKEETEEVKDEEQEQNEMDTSENAENGGEEEGGEEPVEGEEELAEGEEQMEGEETEVKEEKEEKADKAAEKGEKKNETDGKKKEESGKKTQARNRREEMTPEQKKLTEAQKKLTNTVYIKNYREDARVATYLSKVLLRTIQLDDLNDENIAELMKSSENIVLKLHRTEEGVHKGVLELRLFSAEVAKETEKTFVSPREGLTCTQMNEVNYKAYTQEKAEKGEGGEKAGPKYPDAKDVRMMLLGELQPDVTEEQLRSLLPADDVESILIARDVASNPKGYAYVELKKKEKVTELVHALNGKELEGKQVIAARLGRFPDLDGVLRVIEKHTTGLNDVTSLSAKRVKILQNLLKRGELCLQNTPIPKPKHITLRTAVDKIRGAFQRIEKMKKGGMSGPVGGGGRGGRGGQRGLMSPRGSRGGMGGRGAGAGRGARTSQPPKPLMGAGGKPKPQPLSSIRNTGPRGTMNNKNRRGGMQQQGRNNRQMGGFNRNSGGSSPRGLLGPSPLMDMPYGGRNMGGNAGNFGGGFGGNMNSGNFGGGMGNMGGGFGGNMGGGNMGGGNMGGGNMGGGNMGGGNMGSGNMGGGNMGGSNMGGSNMGGGSMGNMGGGSMGNPMGSSSLGNFGSSGMGGASNVRGNLDDSWNDNQGGRGMGGGGGSGSNYMNNRSGGYIEDSERYNDRDEYNDRYDDRRQPDNFNPQQAANAVNLLVGLSSILRPKNQSGAGGDSYNDNYGNDNYNDNYNSGSNYNDNYSSGGNWSSGGGGGSGSGNVDESGYNQYYGLPDNRKRQHPERGSGYGNGNTGGYGGGKRQRTSSNKGQIGGRR